MYHEHKQLPLPPQLPPQGQYDQLKDELRRLLAADPEISVFKLAQALGKPQSTTMRWLSKIRAEL